MNRDTDNGTIRIRKERPEEFDRLRKPARPARVSDGERGDHPFAGM